MKDPRFPELSYPQVKKLEAFGTKETCEEDCKVFEAGEKQYDFFVVLDGEIAIYDKQNDKNIVVHGKYEFTGDSGMLSTRAAQFDAIAKAGTKYLRIKSDQLKEAIKRNSDLSDILLDAFLLRQQTVLSEMSGGLKLVGSGNSTKTYEIRDFLEKNHLWYTFIDVETQEEATELLASFDLSKEDLPFLINGDSKICKKPTVEELARYSGVLMDFEDKVFDVLIIGAGPSGLAASVYAASEGLSVVTIDGEAPGGQAGKSSKIENYLGFPTGISGSH